MLYHTTLKIVYADKTNKNQGCSNSIQIKTMATETSIAADLHMHPNNAANDIVI